MGEIIFLHVGQTGCQIGSTFWDLLYKEHGVSQDGTSSSEIPLSFFSHSVQDTFSPRSIFIDLDHSPIDNIRKSGKFNPEFFVSGKENSANNFAAAYYRFRGSLREETENTIRKSVERCENFQGFLISHSVCGGTGGGVTSEILRYLYTEFNKKLVFTFTHFPSPSLSNIIVEPYNAIYSLSEMYDYSSATVLFDNQAGYKISSRFLNNNFSNFSDVNKLIACSISAMTASLRYEGTLNLSLQDMATNLIPFTRLKFLINSYAPFISQESNQSVNTDVLTQSVFNPDFFLNSCDPSLGYYIASCLLYRGSVTPREVLRSLSGVKHFGTYIDWCPTGIKCGYNLSSPAVFDGMKKNSVAVSHIASNSCLEIVFRRILGNLNKVFEKHAFYHWYLGEGIEGGHIYEAQNNILDICGNYKELGISSYTDN